MHRQINDEAPAHRRQHRQAAGAAAEALGPETSSGLLWPGAGPSTAKGYPLSLDRRYGGGPAPSNASWATFSRLRAKTLTRSARGVRVALAKCEAILRLQERKKRMRGQAARICGALCRSRVVAEMHQRRETRIAEHLTLVLGIIDRQER
jgi:hypothetical protein